MADKPLRLSWAIFRAQIALVLLPIAGIGLLVYSVVAADLRYRSELQNATLATAMRERVSAFLTAPRMVLSGLDVQFSALGALNGSARTQLLDGVVEQTGLFDTIYLLDGANRVIAVGLPVARQAFRADYEGTLFNEQPFMRSARSAGTFWWSDTFLSPLSDATALALAMPLDDGILMVAHLDVRQLSGYIASLARSSDSLLLVVDKSGHIIAHPDQQLAGQQINISNQPLIASALGGHSRTGALNLFQQHYLATSQLIADVGWVVVAAQPRSRIATEIEQLLWVLFLGSLLALLLAVVISRVLAERLARPIVEISQAAARLKQGDFDLRLPRSAVREVDALSVGFAQMANELREQQRTLRQSERRYRQLVDQVPCVICRVDVGSEGRVQFIGRTVERLSGYAVEAFDYEHGIGLGALVHPEDQSMRNKVIQMRAEQLKPWGIEYRLRHRDGTERWVYEEGRAYLNARGEVEHYDLMIIDNTQRKIAERNRQEQVELMLTLLDTVPGPIYYRNSYGEFLGCNRAFEQLLQLKQTDLLGQNLSALHEQFPLLSDIAAHEGDVLKRVCTSDAELTLAVRGDVRHLTLKTASFTGGGQDVAGMIGVLHDVTDRVRTEQENRRLQRYLSNVFDAMPSALIGVDREGQITRTNREARLRMQSDGVSEQASGALLAQQLGLPAGWLEQGLSASDVTTLSRVPRFGGRLDDIVLYPLDLEVGGGAVLRIDDVTEQARLEEMMVQSEKMLSVGGLAAGMAHEINNPLAGILHNAQVLRNRLNADLPANLRAADACGVPMAQVLAYLEKRNIPAMLSAIEESGVRAARIVENMLSFARKSDADFVRADLADLLEQTIRLTLNDYDLKKNYDFRNVSLKRDFKPVPAVRCAPSKLQQVFFNLLKNSAQAMGAAQIRQPTLWLSVSRRKQVVRVSIADNGPGIPRNEAKRVFEPFFTTKEVGIGTGLGLSVSYFIVTENHAGRMWVEPRPGGGACFVVELPLTEEA